MSCCPLMFSVACGGVSGPGMKMHGKMKEFGPQIGIIGIILCPLDLPMVLYTAEYCFVFVVILQSLLSLSCLL